MAVEETEDRKEDRWPSRGQRAIEETEGCRGDRGLLRKQRVIKKDSEL
jgi:hypothetical protein